MPRGWAWKLAVVAVITGAVSDVIALGQPVLGHWEQAAQDGWLLSVGVMLGGFWLAWWQCRSRKHDH